MALRTADGLVEVTHDATSATASFDLDAERRDGLPVWEVWRDDTYTLTHELVDGVVIDVGAHVGAFSVLAAALHAERVHAFEPHPATFARLRDNVALNCFERVITPEPYALAAVAGVAHIEGDDATAHFVEASDSSTLVTTITLEEVIRTALVGAPNNEIACLKLDIEGAEYDVLEVLPDEWLRHVRHIVMEFHGSGNGNASIDLGWVGEQFRTLVGGLAENGAVHVLGRPSVGGILRWDRY